MPNVIRQWVDELVLGENANLIGENCAGCNALTWRSLTQITASVLLAFALAGIATPTTARQAEVYKLIIGDRFEIVFSSGPMQFRYVGVEDGLRKFSVTWKGNPNWIRYQDADLNMVRMLRPDDGRMVTAWEYDPPQAFYKTSMQVGDMWAGTSYRYTWNFGFFSSGSRSGTLQEVRVLAYEEVTVPAGKFMAYKLHVKDLKDGADRPREELLWVVPGLGPIKRENSEFSSRNYEMTKFEPAPRRQ
ncbi:MAG: hypothetical protein HOB72_07025 [Rhodospirillaceae bacterium]|jgi:hypothetical protein|nr:hypothetical protein [Rhodospirillaceae bacterium]